jgi:hypothetical protein
MTKTTVVSLFAITLLALTGIGYAAFTSTATANINASAGTLNLYFSYGTVTTYTSVAGTCTAYASGGQLYVSYTNAAPGDTCSFYGTIANAGSLPATSVSLTYYAWQSYGPGGTYCDTTTGQGNCIFYEDDSLVGTSGPSIHLTPITGPPCSPNLVGTTFATAAVCQLPWSDISPYASGFQIAAGSSSSYYSGIVTVLGPGTPGQLGAQQGQTAYMEIQITGSVGT